MNVLLLESKEFRVFRALVVGCDLGHWPVQIDHKNHYRLILDRSHSGRLGTEPGVRA